MMHPQSEQLNSQQQEAVQHTQGPSIILAGAGSGKTRVLIHKVIHLIAQMGVPAHEILMITFTNKAAGEMKERIARSVQHLSLTSPEGELGFVGTFHSFCAKMLRIYGEHIGLRSDFVIYTDQDQLDLIKRIVRESSLGHVMPSWVLNRISDAKNQLIPPEDFLKTYSYRRAPQVAEIYEMYQGALVDHHAVDFDDLIMRAVHLLRTNVRIRSKYHEIFTHIMIDEFQDTNLAQYALARLLAPPESNITVVGDFSQAIYSWRGADIRNLERFCEDFPTARIYYLEQNYRSTQQILDYAYSKIMVNQTHPILKLFTHAPKGNTVNEFEAADEAEEAHYIARNISDVIGVSGRSGDDNSEAQRDRYAQFAVLYRTNAQSRMIEEVFLQYGIPYTLVGGTRFYDRKEVRDVIAYLRLIVSPYDPVALDRVMKIGKRRYRNFAASLPDLQEYAVQSTPDTLIELTLAKTDYLSMYDREDPADLERIANIRELKSVAATQPNLTDLFERIALIENEYSVGERSRNKGTGVRLMSLHASKGLEFDTVFITGLEDGLLPHSRSLENTHALEEERRLFYVGITRARSSLHITWARHRGVFGRRSYSVKSRFLDNAPADEFDPDPSVSSSGDEWEW